MMKIDKIVVSDKSLESDDAYDIIYSNITVINVLFDEGAEEDHLHPAAYGSYLVDYYLAQVNNGGFSQFVYNSKWNKSVNARILEGLRFMKAEKHVRYLEARIALLNDFSDEQIEQYCNGEYFGENQTRDQLNDDAFFEIKEDLFELNGKFLRGHADLLALSIPNMFKKLEAYLGKKIER